MNQQIEADSRQPLGRGPERGEVVPVNPDVLWFRLVSAGAPMGGVNVWALRDGQGWAMVDTGFADTDTAEQWDGILAQLDGPITRIICTHFHPDHVGQVGNLLARNDVPLWMTAAEWDRAQRMAAPRDATSTAVYAEHLRKCGLEPAWLEQLAGASNRPMTTGLPSRCNILSEGDELALGGGIWRVQLGAGHSPAPAILVNERDRLMIVGDQLLMRITPHIGIEETDVHGDPLGRYFDYLADAAEIASDMLALPGHGPAFVAAGQRAAEIAEHHREQLDVLHEALVGPTLVIDAIETLFGRPLKGISLILGLTEAHAHLQRLVVEDRAKLELDADGGFLFVVNPIVP